MLSGSLTEFGLGDVFSLLSATRKTGVLNLEHDGVRGRIWIASGGLCYAVADVSHSPLAARLVHDGVATVEDVDGAMLDQAADGIDGVADGLVAMGLDQPAARALLLDQVTDAVFDLTRWDSGTFAFDPCDGDDAIPVCSTAEVLETVDRRRDEWVSCVAAIPSTDLVVSLITRPVTTGTIQVDVDHWAVLTLIDGRRSVAELVTITGLGQFTVTCTLAALQRDGLVRVGPASDPDGGTTDVADERSLEVLASPGTESSSDSCSSNGDTADVPEAPARDRNVDADLLARLIDGVKGA